MACPAERGRVTRGDSQSNSEPKSRSSDKGTHVRSAGNFGPKPPTSTHRCGRDHAWGSCGQCRKDRRRSCSVMRGSSRCRRCCAVVLRPRTTTSARTDRGGRLPLLMKAEMTALCLKDTVDAQHAFVGQACVRRFSYMRQRHPPKHSGHRKANWPSRAESCGLCCEPRMVKSPTRENRKGF